MSGDLCNHCHPNARTERGSLRLASIAAQLARRNVADRDEGDEVRCYKANQSIEGREIISQKMASTAAKAGKPNANQSRNKVL